MFSISNSEFVDDFDDQTAAKNLSVEPSAGHHILPESPKLQRLTAEQKKTQLQEITPPFKAPELGEFEMKVHEKIVTDSAERAKIEYDLNTAKNNETVKLYAPKPIDLWVKCTLDSYFGGACLDFFDAVCLTPLCPRQHSLPDYDIVCQKLEKATMEEVDEVYDICSKISNLFKICFPLFLEVFIKKAPNNDSRLAQMLMHCEQNPPFHRNYIQIVAALVRFKNVQRYKAIKWLISHHTDSPQAQEIILSMVIDAGPDLIRLMDYIKLISRKRTIPIQVIEKIALNVTTFQDPSVPYFVLNNLFNKPLDQLQQMNQEILTNFIKFQSMQIQMSSDGEDKLMELATTVTQSK